MKRNTPRQAKGPGGRPLGPGRFDAERFDATTDEDIARQIAEDPDTAPEFTDEMMAEAEWVLPTKKVPIALRVDPDVLAHFKAQGRGYQSRMNAVLRSYVARQLERERAPGAPAPRSTGKTAKASAPRRSSRRGEGK